VHQSGGTLDNQGARVKEKVKVEKAKEKEVKAKARARVKEEVSATERATSSTLRAIAERVTIAISSTTATAKVKEKAKVVAEVMILEVLLHLSSNPLPPERRIGRRTRRGRSAANVLEKTTPVETVILMTATRL